ncbi:hypothetical protein FKP32DRAFT_666103 [Trametes sanguinea]|nr:hypothetical protein FKP32DRAFT_666103 [Trametes sanguinea]
MVTLRPGTLGTSRRTRRRCDTTSSHILTELCAATSGSVGRRWAYLRARQTAPLCPGHRACLTVSRGGHTSIWTCLFVLGPTRPPPDARTVSHIRYWHQHRVVGSLEYCNEWLVFRSPGLGTPVRLNGFLHAIHTYVQRMRPWWE